MMTNTSLSLVFSCISTLLLCSGANSQVEDPCGEMWNTPLSEVEGEIVSIYYAAPFPLSENEGLHLELSEGSSDEHVVIHVFPKACIESYPEKFQFELGEVVTVLGSAFLTDTEVPRNICAAAITQRPELQLRTLDTGCLNQGLCVNCQVICDEQCETMPNSQACVDICLPTCESNIIPCEVSNASVNLTPLYPLLLSK
ncbi:MAG: hypothetical protein WGN25_00745 [Candidatus Electrothrix sp. GW3-4]|uniref:hypothetical protein n=1 Tax=Candidatus Electrothrix sp. GW3-4 TaxID=3126740 RepID=UPI0030D5117E